MAAQSVTVTYLDDAKTPATVKIIYADRVRYDLERNRRGWPNFTDAAFLGMAFWAWAALTRQKLTDDPFDSWVETIADVEGTEKTDAPKA